MRPQALLLLALLAPPAAGQTQPAGVSDPIYNCTYGTGGMDLNITINGTSVVCGAPRAFKGAETVDQPAVALIGADPAAGYTVFILNPDDSIPIKPIVHVAVGNWLGADLAKGQLGNADVLSAWHPPLAFGKTAFHYCYLAFKQATPQQNFSGSIGMRFPIAKYAKDNQLALVQSNYFIVG